MKRLMRGVLATALLSGVAVGYGADLIQVYQQALANDPGLKAQQATQEAGEQVAGVDLAPVLPTVTLRAATVANQTNGHGYEDNNATLSLTQDLWNLNAWSTAASGHYAAMAAESTYQSQLQQFILTVATDYFAVREAADNVNLGSANVALLKQTLQQTQQRYSVGLAAITDVKQAEANYDSALATLIANENSLDIAKEQLMVLTNVHYDELAGLGPEYPFVAPEPNNVNVWVARATQNNAALQAARYQSSASYSDAVASGGNLLPTVQFVSSITREHNNADIVGLEALGQPSRNNRNIVFALQLSWNLFNSGGLTASTLQAAHTYEAQEATQDQTYRSVVSQTRQDFAAVLSNQSLVKAYQESVTAAQASLDQYEAEYRVGTQTIVGVLSAVQTLYQAQQNLVQARYQYVQSVLQLEFDAGDLSEADLVKINHYLRA